ncbi:T9SS type A sorting domain-containing protein [Chryseobacterium sp. Ch-15]|uniref:T9SS type A sorting domain-containing protein n=1 Tax=Chryseobacterium muglaense TaxID=2893752 RepID=A0A9Q3YPI9_9FLAO|nr:MULTISPECIES: choice-of-anchor J domain-containing protein [Chryseobacterium]MBD3903955.1 T9SS type A sorting domain-containing protein [Chryseobacterium muglaense]MBO6184658.1 T9SS type A sorting domain-containing protein [Chryseobacterium sp.]MCC9032859.1 T9SS type A sorting domain-containing protein [Chryseobacterium muglaense]MCM2553604.1 T9SS type A sorting domain-containing protein [Chryseobacterium muglaense]
MKKILLLSTCLGLGLLNAQNVYSYGFDTAFSTDWARTNQSTSANITTIWSKAAYITSDTSPNAIFGSGVGGVPVGQSGGANSFALVNYSSTTGSGTISNWLISPVVNVKDGDVVSFYSRKGTDGAMDYPDRLELRYSTAATTVVPSTGPTDVGSFTTLGVTINSALAAGFVYPKTWTQYSFTITGVGNTPIPIKFGFRYFVTNGGTTGLNSDIIGIDTFSVDRSNLGVNDVKTKKSLLSIYPNPTTDFLTIKTEKSLGSVSIFDISGKNVNVKLDGDKVDVRNLPAGTYLINVETKDGISTEKFIKK